MSTTMTSSVVNKTRENVVCYSPTMITTNGIWQGENPLDFSLPLFVLQLTLVVVTTRIIVFALKPFRQPRVIAEILGGIIMGPSILGRSSKFAETIFPIRSLMVLETMANVGLVYFLFLVGVEMDVTLIRRTGLKAFSIALAGMVLPFLVGLSFTFMLHHQSQGTFILYLGIALSVTAFPVLARILAELKLINTELGRIAMSAALLNDIFAWILLAIAMALSENDNVSWASVWVILSSATFVLFCVFIIRPIIGWMIRQTPEGESISEFYICIILTGVMVAGFITDAIGTHSVFGSFVFGLIIPNGPLGMTLIERLEDFISGLMVPLFFVISGLKTNLGAIDGVKTWGTLVVVIVLSCAGKVAGTVVLALYYKIPLYDGLTIGLLMNAKGIVEMIVLNVGKDEKVFDDQCFAIMVMVAIGMTAIITPVVTIIYKPARKFAPYKRRTVQRTKLDSEFRVLVCVHTPRNVPTIINLLEASYPTKKSPICIYVLHLVELTGRASAMLIVHNTRKTGRPALNRTQAQSDHIINAFENFEQHVGCVSVQPLTAISPYPSMHEDICTVAEDKRVALIIIPFHKQQTVDGGMEATNPAFRTINQNVLANAPCSIGILVDRGLNGSTRLAMNQVSHHVAVLFFGGPDDREALAYGLRMKEHPGVNLTVLRFLPGEAAIEATIEATIETTRSSSTNNANDQGTLTVVTNEDDKEKKLDEDYINEFRARTANDDSVVYTEKVVNHGEETVAVVRSIDTSHDLFIVGRGQGSISPLTAGLTDWSEFPELGAIGDLLASADFATTISVLVVQQYVGLGIDQVGTPDSPNQPHDYEHFNFNHINLRPQTRGQNHIFHSQP